MKKEDLKEGESYKMTTKTTPVIFKWWTKDGKWAICNPVGEPDMQSSMCLSADELEPLD